ncbi:MAG: 3'-5' exonuclease [Pyrinomonadaceae bacterium]
MIYNSKQLYTPPLETYEFGEPALLIDTETIGTGPLVEIVEIAIGNTQGEILFESLVQPIYNPIPPRSKHHRFEPNEIKNAPVWTEVWPEVSRFTEDRLLIAYNAPFDRRAIAASCYRHRQSSNESGWRCAMQLLKQTMGVQRSPTLEQACAYYGLPGGNHRAARDVLALGELLRQVTMTVAAEPSPT